MNGGNMERKMILRNMENGAEMTLPVTPSSLSVSHGIHIETVNINGTGDVNLAGYGTLATIRADLLFPSRKYPFVIINQLPAPYAYIDTFQRFIDEHTLARLIFAGTAINIPVMFESLEYSEKDGTNDIYATIVMREYRELKMVQLQSTSLAGSNGPRTPPAQAGETQSYTIQKGDTLGAICRKFYGNAGLAQKLAAANGIKNANLIRAGSTIKIPEKGKL